MRSILLSLGLAALSVSAQEGIPEELRVPPTQKLVLESHGVGKQIYVCKAVEGKYVWILKGPTALLEDKNHRIIGHHFAGPTWESDDGSQVVGKAAASVASPDPQSIPWLRVEAIKHDKDGIMSGVVSIQRLNTKGGKAPGNGCIDASSVGGELGVAYEADYYFFANAK